MGLQSSTEYEFERAFVRKALTRPVVMVGMMGAGKSQIGRRLAHELTLEFLDSDALIEQRAGMSVTEIFERHGEAKFRESEFNAISAVCDRGALVLATGGGALTNPKLLEILQEKTIMIWLKADLENLERRLKFSQKRPLLASGDPKTILADLMAKREALYGRSHIHIDTLEHSPGGTVKTCIKSLYAFLNDGKFEA